MIPYSRPKRSDLYTLSWSKLLENHTLHSGTYLYSPNIAVPPPPPPHGAHSQAIIIPLSRYLLVSSSCTSRLLHAPTLMPVEEAAIFDGAQHLTSTRARF